MSSGGGSEEETDAIARASAAAEEIYHLRDTFFPRDPEEKISRLQTLADAALALLDSHPSEQRKSPLQRANYEYLRGKILDVFPEYRKEAEDHLSKAVKLNPSLADAWLCLGNCIWKKGDLLSAKNCYSLALSKGPNKKILCQLSMLERSMAQGAENKATSVEESIKHAREAVQLDIKDGNSWYNLGNACLTSFFVTGAWDYAKLQQSLKAYQNAEKDELMHSNPDLYFNCASANKYLENYERALHGFEAAALKDPGLDAGNEVRKIICLMDKIESSMKGLARAKRLSSLVPSLGEFSLKLSHRKVTISVLKEGLNKAVAVVGKVLLFIKHENVAPLYYLICDSDQTCFLLSVCGLHTDATNKEHGVKESFMYLAEALHPDNLIDLTLHGLSIKEGDRVTLMEPYYRVTDFSWKDKHYHFQSIRVDFVEQILVNEKVPAPNHIVRASIYAQHKA